MIAVFNGKPYTLSLIKYTSIWLKRIKKLELHLSRDYTRMKKEVRRSWLMEIKKRRMQIWRDGRRVLFMSSHEYVIVCLGLRAKGWSQDLVGRRLSMVLHHA